VCVVLWIVSLCMVWGVFMWLWYGRCVVRILVKWLSLICFEIWIKEFNKYVSFRVVNLGGVMKVKVGLVC
jgi:hypothetical protein